MSSKRLREFALMLLFVRVAMLSTIFSHITTVSGSARELNAHFYSAASLKYHAQDTWHDTTPSHIILTLGRPVLALPVSLSAKRGAASTIFNDFGMLQPRIEHMTFRSPKREWTLYQLCYQARLVCIETSVAFNANRCNIATSCTKYNFEK